jgi:hypothetical protein
VGEPLFFFELNGPYALKTNNMKFAELDKINSYNSIMTVQHIWLRLGISIFIAVLLLFAGTASAQEDKVIQPDFRDVSKASGFVAPRHGREKTTGQAWGDYDQDGWLDIYVTDSAGPNILYRNNGDGSFTISSLSESVALWDAESGGAVFADYDNDGWPDLYVMNWGPNVLFHNEQGQGFRDVTETAGVGDAKNGSSASWGDYDQDGFLDLYVANWACAPRCARPQWGDADRLYHNNGDGTFSDVSQLLGGSTNGAGFIATFVDYDNDGDPDIYLVNDEFINPIGNKLWRNDGPGCDGHCFTDVSEEAGADTTVMGMGLATADFDADGDLDFYFSNAGPMTLLRNEGDGTFADIAEASGVMQPSVAWGTLFFDYDNDGWLDLYLAVMEGLEGETAANLLFANEGDGTFKNISAGSGADDPGRSTGVSYADYDADGRVDLVVGNYDDGYRLYRNESSDAEENNWLAIKLVGDGPVNRDAVGARVTVTDSDGRKQLQEVKNGSSLGAGNTLSLHYGLAQSNISNVAVHWPDGSIQDLGELKPNKQHIIRYGENPSTIPWLYIGLILAAVFITLLILFIFGRTRLRRASVKKN